MRVVAHERDGANDERGDDRFAALALEAEYHCLDAPQGHSAQASFHFGEVEPETEPEKTI